MNIGDTFTYWKTGERQIYFKYPVLFCFKHGADSRIVNEVDIEGEWKCDWCCADLLGVVLEHKYTNLMRLRDENWD